AVAPSRMAMAAMAATWMDFRMVLLPGCAPRGTGTLHCVSRGRTDRQWGVGSDGSGSGWPGRGVPRRHRKPDLSLHRPGPLGAATTGKNGTLLTSSGHAPGDDGPCARWLSVRASAGSGIHFMVWVRRLSVRSGYTRAHDLPLWSATFRAPGP